MLEFSSTSHNANIIADLSDAIGIASDIRNCDRKNISLNFSKVENTSPAFIIPLLLAVDKLDEDSDIVNSDVLNKILFPHGLQTNSLRQILLKARLREYAIADFSPILVFPSNSDEEDLTSQIIGNVENALFEKLSMKENIKNGLRYIIGEIVDNITQHSKSQNGYIYWEYNRDGNFLDVAIADNGIGLLGSYKDNEDADIVSDIEAIQAANRGISTKNLPEAENRGFGIITSKKMIIDGLKGMFIMISGHAALIKTENLNKYLYFSEDIDFKGTTVIFRIPLEVCKFNYINYVE